MGRSAVETRKRILGAAYVEFRRHGFARVSMDSIAAASGVTKRALYHHFDSKDTLLGSVLEDQHGLALAAFATFADALAGSPDDMVGRLFDELETWTAAPRWAGSGFTRLVAELADLPGHPARAIARRHKAALESHLAARLALAGLPDAPAAARALWILLEGVMVMLLVHGDRAYLGAARDAGRVLVRARAEGRSPAAASET